MDDTLSIRLAEIEHAARRGEALPPEETLTVVGLMRSYMAYAEMANRAMERIQAVIDAGKA